jgi:hypothetical protein
VRLVSFGNVKQIPERLVEQVGLCGVRTRRHHQVQSLALLLLLCLLKQRPLGKGRFRRVGLVNARDVESRVAVVVSLGNDYFAFKKTEGFAVGHVKSELVGLSAHIVTDIEKPD